MNNETAELPKPNPEDAADGMVYAKSVQKETAPAQPTPSRWEIPAHALMTVRDLADANQEARVRVKCAHSRIEKAIEAGDEVAALAERRAGIALERSARATHTSLLNTIRAAVPEIPTENDGLHFDTDSGVVSIQSRRLGLSAF